MILSGLSIRSRLFVVIKSDESIQYSGTEDICCSVVTVAIPRTCNQEYERRIVTADVDSFLGADKAACERDKTLEMTGNGLPL